MNFELNLPSNAKKSKDIVVCLVEYLNTQTMNKICQIRYNETLFRHKLLHPRHRSASSKINSQINIYPEVIIDIFENVFTRKELDFLSSFGKSSLSFCLSYFNTGFFDISISRWSKLYSLESDFGEEKEISSTQSPTRTHYYHG